MSTTGWSSVLPGVWATVYPQAAATWRVLVCLGKMASLVSGATQHLDAGGYSLNSLPKALSQISPQAFLVHSTPTPFAGVQGKWLQMKFYALVLEMALCFSQSPSLAECSNLATLCTWMLSVLFWLWCYRLGISP